MVTALVTNIQGYSIHDGPGIRTVVFLKGCGLECQWCSNPECISPRAEVGFYKTLCTGCGRCAGVCPEGALVFEAGRPQIDRRQCTGCGACSAVCDYKALMLYGQPMGVDAVFDAVKRDAMFYAASGGGVTVSGGEVLLQPQFTRELLEKCRTAGIQTCIETAGFGTEAALQQILPFTDLVLFDIKHHDSQKHRRYTGQPNNRILENAQITTASGVEVLFRMPLIPGINDDQTNIMATAEFINALGKKYARIELMPYHRLGKGKYESLEKAYPLNDLAGLEADRTEPVKQAFEERGINCKISR